MSCERLIDCLATTDALADVFSDDSVLAGDARFRGGAGARRQARARASFRRLPRRSSPRRPRRGGSTSPRSRARHARSATPAIPLVEALTERGSAQIDPAAPRTCTGARPARMSPTRRWSCSCERAHAAHRRRSRTARAGPARAVGASRRHRHAGTHAAAAGHADDVWPEGGGLVPAPIARSWRGCRSRLASRRCVIQFGGAAGTLAALGDARTADGRSSSRRELGLPVPRRHGTRIAIASAALITGLRVVRRGARERSRATWRC